MKLTAIQGKNSYCGPAAIAAIVGISTDAAAKAIRETGYKRKSVRRLHPEELEWALAKLGYAVHYQQMSPSDTPTLAKWIRDREDRAAVNIVYVTGHYAVVSGNKYIDNHTKEAVWISKAPGRRKRVKGVLTVEKKACK